MANENNNPSQEPGVKPSEVHEQSASAAAQADSEYRPPSTLSRMNRSSTRVNNSAFRRARIQELAIKGYNQIEIAAELEISQPTVSRELQKIEQGFLERNDRYAEQMGSENGRIMLVCDEVQKGLWKIVDNPATSISEAIRAYSMINQCSGRRHQANSNRRIIKQWADALKKEDEDRARKKREDEVDAIKQPARTRLSRYKSEGVLPENKSLKEVVQEAFSEGLSGRIG